MGQEKPFDANQLHDLLEEHLVEVSNILATKKPTGDGKEVDAHNMNYSNPETGRLALTSTTNLVSAAATESQSSPYLIEGTPHDDLLFDTSKNGVILAGDGDDWFIAWRDHNDHIYGGGGNDFMYAGEGDDSAYGGSGHDLMYGDSTYRYPYLFVTTDPVTLSAKNTALEASKSSSLDTNGLIHPFLYYPYLFTTTDTATSSSDYYYPHLFAAASATSQLSPAGINSLIYPYPYSNSGNDYMHGGEGNDYMYGGGGNDTIDGGSGDDTLVGNNRKDYRPSSDTQIAHNNDRLLLETTSVQARNVDNVTETSISGTTNSDALQSDSLKLALGAAIHRPISYSDQDILTGGLGADNFVFYSPHDGVDRITDFNQSEGDQIQVSRYGFGGGLSYGELPEEQFILGTSAQDAHDRFIYNWSTGSLFFDADGNGTHGQVLFAQLSGNTGLSHSNILIM